MTQRARRPLIALLLIAIAAPALAKDAPPSTEVRITKTWEKADLREVIKEIALQAKANVIVSNEVQGTISVRLDNVPWFDALDQVARSAGCGVKAEGNGIYIVLPLSKLELDTDYYRFRNWRPSVSSDPKTDPAMPTFIKALATVAAFDKGSVRYIPAQNAAIFTGHHRTIKALKALMAGLDAAILQQPGAKAYQGVPAAPMSAERERYEALLQGARTEAAAKYFIERLASTQKNYENLYGTVK